MSPTQDLLDALLTLSSAEQDDVFRELLSRRGAPAPSAQDGLGRSGPNDAPFAPSRKLEWLVPGRVSVRADYLVDVHRLLLKLCQGQPLDVAETATRDRVLEVARVYAGRAQQAMAYADTLRPGT